MPTTEPNTGCYALDVMLRRGCPLCGQPLEYTLAHELNGAPIHHAVCATGREGWFHDTAELLALQLNTDGLLYGGACQNDDQ